MKQKRHFIPVAIVTAVILLVSGIVYYYISYIVPKQYVERYLEKRYNVDYTNVDKSSKNINKMLNKSYMNYLDKNGILGNYIEQYKNLKLKSTIIQCNVSNIIIKNGTTTVCAYLNILFNEGDVQEPYNANIGIEFILKKKGLYQYSIYNMTILNASDTLNDSESGHDGHEH